MRSRKPRKQLTEQLTRKKPKPSQLTPKKPALQSMGRTTKRGKEEAMMTKRTTPEELPRQIPSTIMRKILEAPEALQPNLWDALVRAYLEDQELPTDFGSTPPPSETRSLTPPKMRGVTPLRDSEIQIGMHVLARIGSGQYEQGRIIDIATWQLNPHRTYRVERLDGGRALKDKEAKDLYRA